MGKHTGEQWEADSIFVRVQAGRVIARCDGGNRIANAMLMAAAPDLLEALRAILKFLPLQDSNDSKIFMNAIAAITKAQTGTQE